MPGDINVFVFSLFYSVNGQYYFFFGRDLTLFVSSLLQNVGEIIFIFCFERLFCFVWYNLSKFFVYSKKSILYIVIDNQSLIGGVYLNE